MGSEFRVSKTWKKSLDSIIRQPTATPKKKEGGRKTKCFLFPLHHCVLVYPMFILDIHFYLSIFFELYKCTAIVVASVCFLASGIEPFLIEFSVENHSFSFVLFLSFFLRHRFDFSKFGVCRIGRETA